MGLTYKLTAAIALLAFVFTFLPAYAHPVLSPRTSIQGSLEVYRLVVPNEHPTSPIVEVELIVPEGIEVQSIEPTTGWAHAFSYDSSGRISKVVWKGFLKPGGQVEFRFVAKNTGPEGIYAFRAPQKYADGLIEEFDRSVKVEARVGALTLTTAGYTAVGLAVAMGLVLGLMLAKRRGKERRR